MIATKSPAHEIAEKQGPLGSGDDIPSAHVTVINASGHVQEVDRQFNLLAVTSLGIVAGSIWPALGGSILVALYNGGPTGVIYEFIVVTICYLFVYASIAELASAIPSSAGVYHWASVGAGPRYGKAIGFFAGWWNFLAWTLGGASISSIVGNIVVSMYAMYHPNYEYARWHVFVVYLVISWSACLVVAFANRALPHLYNLGLVFIVTGGAATTLCLAIIPGTSGNGYASTDSVWTLWQNQTGYTSDGFAFLAGMLNGAYAVGTPDVVAHLSEEVPDPRRNIPRAMLAQLVVGFLLAFPYIIALFYSTSDFAAIAESTLPLPLATIYEQATSRAGAMGLLFLLLFPICICACGTFITAGRCLWTLARDNATPFSSCVGRIDSRGKNPRNATLLVGCLTTIIGCTYVASLTAFNAFVGSFVLLSTLSYIAAILPTIINRRKYITPGPFEMEGMLGYVVRVVSCTYMIVFIVIFCFPFSMPVTPELMNYTVVIVGGFTVLMALLYVWKRKHGYVGPVVMQEGQIVSTRETKHGEIILE